MTSNQPDEAYVWVWLPGAQDPVVAGRLDQTGDLVRFTYAQSYRANSDAISLYEPELPLEPGEQTPKVGDIAGCIADAGPDSWGQRVILNRLVGSSADDPIALSVLTYLLESGSDRIGALDFQASPRVYKPRIAGEATLVELAESAERVQRGEQLSEALDKALLHGSSVGGARPKALLRDGDRRYIAKFSVTGDPYSIVKGEYVAMTLAQRVGLQAAKVKLTTASERDVLLVERFDRTDIGTRRALVSANTILGLGELGYRDGSYCLLADQMRANFTKSDATLRELFGRIIFNIFTGNIDDHPRNHAAFWDGRRLTLTPAYDIAPQPRNTGETRQLMAIGRDGWRDSNVAGCVDRAADYLLTREEATAIVAHQLAVIRSDFDEVCTQANVTETDRKLFWGRQFLNPSVLYGWEENDT
jgi:serine/threonine-protein kinase HipA